MGSPLRADGETLDIASVACQQDLRRTHCASIARGLRPSLRRVWIIMATIGRSAVAVTFWAVSA
jgi:hypothetical protein